MPASVCPESANVKRGKPLSDSFSIQINQTQVDRLEAGNQPVAGFDGESESKILEGQRGPVFWRPGINRLVDSRSMGAWLAKWHTVQ